LISDKVQTLYHLSDGIIKCDLGLPRH